ncbi:MAG: DUF5696 domain-containing protein [Clostridiales Family XIII bacterium]|nr:DUF5696 domain-containing protein [Clostridiales Family XIII bacterium]
MKKRMHRLIGVKRVGRILLAAVLAATLLSPVYAEEEAPADTAISQIGDADLSVVAQKDGLTLLADRETGCFLLRGADGAEWYSAPGDAAVLESMKGALRNRILSVVSGTTLDLETGKETTFYAQTLAQSGKMDYEAMKDGYRLRFRVEDAVEFTLEIALRSGYLSLRVPMDEVKETQSHVLKNMRFLEGFGAGKDGDTGFMLLPDGMGTIMPFTSKTADVYNEPVYGWDRAYIREALAVQKRDVALPVYGVERNGFGAVLALHNGETAANIHAAPATGEMPYGTVFAEYSLRGSEAVSITRGAEKTLFEENRLLQDDIETRVYLAEHRDTGYMGLADAYRRYLTEGLGMAPLESDPGTTVLSVSCGVEGTTRVLGVPLFPNVTEVTALKDVWPIANTLRRAGATGLRIEISDWDKNAILGKASGTPAIPASLGGSSEMRNLIDRCAENDVKLYDGVFAQSFARDGAGVSIAKDSIRNLIGEPSMQFTFSRVTYAAQDRYYLLKANEVIDRQRERLSAAVPEFSGRSFADMGNSLYSDYDGKTPMSRQETKSAFESFLEECGAFGDVAVHGGFLYAARYADLVVGAPSADSGLRVAEGHVPFYQLALSGLVAYSVPALSDTANADEMLLFALETGSLLGFEAIGRVDSALQGSALEYAYGASWERNSAFAADIAEEYAPLIDRVAGRRITNHRSLAPDVYRTDFENGMTATVNYADTEFRDAEGIIEPFGWRVTAQDGQSESGSADVE